MITVIQPHEYSIHEARIEAYFRLRKKVFADQFGWDVKVENAMERDEFDQLGCTYILVEDKLGRLLGGMRLMPMDGPTLLERQWPHLMPCDTDFCRSDVWEVTRLCVEADDTGLDVAARGSKAGILLAYAAVAHALANGISHYIAVCERRFYQMMNTYGGGTEVLAQAPDDVCGEIFCCRWTIGDRIKRAVAGVHRNVTGGAEDWAQPGQRDAA